jgi:hypothetical protein
MLLPEIAMVDIDSEEEETDSASNECEHGKLPDGKATDKAGGWIEINLLVSLRFRCGMSGLP